MVEDGEDDTKEHLAYSKNDSRLHLVGVGEHKLVVSNTPDLTENGKNNKEYILVQLSYSRALLTGSSPNGYGLLRIIASRGNTVR